jgi:hypothetical protein
VVLILFLLCFHMSPMALWSSVLSDKHLCFICRQGTWDLLKYRRTCDSFHPGSSVILGLARTMHVVGTHSIFSYMN